MSFRYVLEGYIKYPERYPDIVLFQDENAVIVKDLYPKSIFHLLVLPRSRKHTVLRPQIAFQDVRFYKLIQGYVEKAKDILIEQFNEKYELVDPEDSIEDHIKVCCHSVPSLRNLHVHVITKDLYSPRMKNKKHYNSFASSFAIDWIDMPLSKTDPRYDNQKYCLQLLVQDLVLNGHNYTNHFAQLKKALAVEFHKKVRTKTNAPPSSPTPGK